MVAANNSYQEAVALIAAANRVVQDPNSVGAALRTISLRLRGTSVEELEEAGEDTAGVVTSKSKLRSKVKSLSGVDILTDTGAYKSTYEILLDISKVWEDMSDIDQAALLELIAGKTRSNTAAAILSNTEDLEEAFKAAMEAEGSALEENEKYLDSIQGRIDLFNNSVQTMWSNFLDSDVVKWFVDAGTWIIKLIDKLGVLESAFLGFAAISMIKNKMGPIAFLGGISDGIRKISGKTASFAKSIIGAFTGATTATSTLSAATLEASVANGTLTASQAAATATANGLTMSQTQLTAAQAMAIMMSQGVTQADALEITAKLGLTKETQILTAAKIQQAMADGTLTASQGAVAMAMLGTSGATKGLTASLYGLWTALWPILALMAGAAVIYGIVKAIDAAVVTVDELAEELDGLRSEFSSIESEIDSLNSELDTANERIAKLIAMPSLSFIEQEELANLQATTKELERQLEIQEALAESKEAEIITTTEDYIEKSWGEDGKKNDASMEDLEDYIDQYADKKKNKDSIGEILRNWDTITSDGLSRDEYAKIYKLMYGKPATQRDINSFFIGGVDTDAFKKSVENIYNDIDLSDLETSINEIFSDENFKDLSYGMSEEIDAFLDEYYNLWLKFKKTTGDYSISQVISKVFESEDKGTNVLKEKIDEITSNDTLDATQKEARVLELVKDAADGVFNGVDTSRFQASLEAIGIEAEQIARYFTAMSQVADSSTVESITAQYKQGLDAFTDFQNHIENVTANSSSILGGFFGTFNESIIKSVAVIGEYTDIATGEVEKITWGSLFDENGNTIDTQIAKLFGEGAEQTVRDEFGRLAKAVNEGKMTVENAMKSFSISSVQAGYKLLEDSVIELNGDIFKDIVDDISSLIDTFDEFGSALESVADAIDLVNQAQAEMAYSGHVSVETALALIESTDDWNKVLKIENGNITLVDGAMDTLAQSKLNQIKTNLQLALSEAQAGLEQARLAENSGEVAKTLEESTTESVRQLAASMTYLSTLIGEFLDGNFLGAHGAAKDAKAESLASTEYQKTTTTSSMSVADWEEKVANIESKLSILEGVDTTEEFENNYSSDDVSGGNKTKKEAEDDLIEQGWENLINEYENGLALITNERDLIEAEIDQMEARGGKASTQYYEDLIRNSNEEKELLMAKKQELEGYLAAYADAIDPETWTEYNNEINETAVAIKECETNTIEWAEALREIDTHYFEQITSEISRFGEELDFVNSLLEDEEVADENGNWSSAALTRLGLYTQQMEMAAVEAQRYQDEIDKLNTQYANGELSEEQYQEKLSDLVSGQQDAIQSYEDAKDGIVELNEARIDAIKDGIDKEIEAYEDLIDLKKEELDAERDLFDFRKNVKKQTKDIATLERRIAALSGSTAASDIAERRKLQAELNEAREGLNDTYYERSKDQQSQALDDEAEAFRESKEKYIEQLEEQLKDTETLIQQSLMDVLLNADSIYEQLAGEEGIAAKYGIQLSDKLTQPWKDASAQATAWKTELQNSMTAGEYAALIGEGGAITAFANGVATKMQGSWNTAQNAVQGYADFLTGAELGNKFSNTITGFGNQIQTIIDKWNGVKTAADAAYNAQTREVTVGGTGTSSSSGSGSSGSGASSSGGGSSSNANVKALQEVLNTVFNAGLTVDGKLGSATTNAIRNAQTRMGITADGKYGTNTRNAIISYIDRQITSWRASAGSSSAVGQGIQAYTNAKNKLPLQLAKGTPGLTKDQFAITDESWIGEEITLAAGKNGQLQYLKKGSAVMPADISVNLIEWGKLNPDMLKVGGGANLNMISNAINKPEIKLDIAEFLHVDKVDKDTMPELEKFVDKKMNDLVRQLNYSIKKFK